MAPRILSLCKSHSALYPIPQSCLQMVPGNKPIPSFSQCLFKGSGGGSSRVPRTKGARPARRGASPSAALSLTTFPRSLLGLSRERQRWRALGALLRECGEGLHGLERLGGRPEARNPRRGRGERPARALCGGGAEVSWLAVRVRRGGPASGAPPSLLPPWRAPPLGECSERASWRPRAVLCVPAGRWGPAERSAPVLACDCVSLRPCAEMRVNSVMVKSVWGGTRVLSRLWSPRVCGPLSSLPASHS